MLVVGWVCFVGLSSGFWFACVSFKYFWVLGVGVLGVADERRFRRRVGRVRHGERLGVIKRLEGKYAGEGQGGDQV